MDMKSIALNMYPYWMMGAFMLWATAKSGFKDLIRVDKKAVFNWVKVLGVLTLYRFAMFKLFPHANMFEEAAKAVKVIPWQMTLTVFWEDACHGLPLLLIQQLIGTKKWTWPIHGLLTAMVMLEFGMGHVYQGVIPAMLLSLYIPYSIRLAKKYGYGTVMIGHSLWDLSTVLALKYFMGG